jgi:hypothetical protein
VAIRFFFVYQSNYGKAPKRFRELKQQMDKNYFFLVPYDEKLKPNIIFAA